MADIYEKLNELYDKRRKIELGGGDDKIEKAASARQADGSRADRAIIRYRYLC
ncbi:hypothetical protein GCM10020331_041650 [Ectobacillus funiculus]